VAGLTRGDAAVTPDRQDRLTGRWPWGWLFGGVWLIYLGDPLGTMLGQPSGLRRDVGLAALIAFAALYLTVWSMGVWRRSSNQPRLRTLHLVQLIGMPLLVLPMLPAAGMHALAAVPYVAVVVMLYLPTALAWTTLAALFVATEAAPRLVPGWQGGGGPGLGVLLAGAAVWGTRLAFERNRALAESREETAALAVAAERSRVARDLHDILGHSLTVVTVKAELAGRLVRSDPARAEAEILDLERLSRQALADIRRALAGYREVSLSGELANARAALNAAGIDAQLPTAIDDVAGEHRELFGWAVREAVTNVIRHSGARRCWVRLGPDWLEVADDGRGVNGGARADRLVTGGPGAGHGLAGLRERARAAGASLSTGPAATGGGFALRLTLDEAVPGPAR